MTNVEIGSHVVIDSVPVVNGAYEVAKNLAREYLEGCTEDYLFFYNGRGVLSPTQSFVQFILIRSDDISKGVNYVATDCMITQIYVVSNTVSSSSSFTFSGSSVDIGSDPVGSFSGSGSISNYDVEYQTAGFSYHRDTVEVESIVDNVIYSSLDNHPHLIEGVQNYAYCAFCVAFAVIMFKLADRLFRRVY